MTGGGRPSSGLRGKLLLLLGASVVTLACLELAVRSLPDDWLGFSFARGAFRTPWEFDRSTSRNSLGFHDVEHGPPVAEMRRVVLLGDSYVDASTVELEQTVGRRLQHHLRRELGRPYEVISMGISTWGQVEQLEILRMLGPRSGTNVVITLFLSLNDVENNSAELRRASQTRNQMMRYRPGWIRLPADEAPLLWLRWSALNRFVSYRLASTRRDLGPDSIPVDYFVYATRYDPVWEEAWKRTESLILEKRDAAHRLGAAYGVVSASTPQGVLGPRKGLEVLMRSYPAMREHEWDLDLPDRRLESHCRRNGIPFLALEPLFREETAKGRRLHWKYDGHWNVEGNDLAAEWIAQFVLAIDATS